MLNEQDCVKLLLVDDLQENLTALRALVARPDVTVFTALSGDEALELLLQHEFALAILDVQMPRMNGFELAEFMRCTERTKNIPIVFVSAAGKDLNYAFKGYESGAVDFLYKPLESYAVKSKVNIFVELYQHRKTLAQQDTALERSRQEQEALLKELQQTQAELQRAVCMRDDFMSVVSHELRTPLNTLKLESYVRRLYIENGDTAAFTLEKLTEMVESDDRQIQRLIRLIDDMSDVARIRTGKLFVRPTRFDLYALVEYVVRQFSQQLALSNCETLIQGEHVEGAWDEFRIEQVIANLLTNAMRYGARKPINITIAALANGAEVTVRDHGIGVGQEDQERIFRQFERAVRGSVGGLGLGLGLYISDQIAKAHGGNLRVQSSVGEGAAFTLFLPFDAIDTHAEMRDAACS
jgi:signal transduction histidine kinase